jgi:predicted nucleic acid-binding protein
VKVLLDTSAAYALTDRRDPFHAAARVYVRTSGLALVTNSAIVAETYTIVRRRIHYRAAMEWVESLRVGGHVTVEHVGMAEDAAIWHILREYAGVPLSYADASVIALGRETGIREVFSFDTDFASCGMRLVPGA